MKRVLAVAGLVAGLALSAVPAAAAPPTPGGKCDGKVDVFCQEHPCSPEWPCHIVICAVWINGQCGLG